MSQHNKNLIEEINFREFPYRGCFTRAAKSLGITPQNVRSAFNRGNPDVIREVTKEVTKINKIVRNGNKAFEEANEFTTINNN